MVKLDNYKKIKINDSTYVVCKFPYKTTYVPIIMDLNVFEQINELNKSWHINDNGFVVTTHKINNDDVDFAAEIYLHDIVMKLNNMNEEKSILHINKLGIDNRISNLMYDTKYKNITKNIRKKTRTVELPKDSGINVDHIPSYVWYVRENDSHGDRFVIDIGNISWKTTSSKKVSLRYKLEEAKKYLRHVKKTMPQIFDEYSMNGDLNICGQALLKSFYEIADKAGYTHLDKINTNCQTDDYLQMDTSGLTNIEIQLLNFFDPRNERFNFR